MEKAGVDLCLYTSTNDPKWLAAHLREVDAFARSLRIAGVV
ncbi:hypothetical protein [Streptomyces sp. NPDC047108]